MLIQLTLRNILLTTTSFLLIILVAFIIALINYHIKDIILSGVYLILFLVHFISCLWIIKIVLFVDKIEESKFKL